MSTWSMVGVRCPRCGGEVQTAIARGVHASRAPAWRARVLDGTLHRATCGGCAMDLDVQSPFVYTDFARGQWVHVGAAGELARWRDVEREALAGFDRWFATSPDARAMAPAFAARVVFGAAELREKLVVWDAGLDDAIVECAKLAALRERPAIRAVGERILVERVDGDGLHVAAVGAEDARRVRARWTTPRAVIDGIDRATWTRAVPALFGRGFVSIDRLFDELDEALDGARDGEVRAPAGEAAP